MTELTSPIALEAVETSPAAADTAPAAAPEPKLLESSNSSPTAVRPDPIFDTIYPPSVSF